MNPELPHVQNGPVAAPQGPAVAPPVSGGGQPVPAAGTAAQQYAAKAKLLVEQYQNDPFQLNIELDKLKTSYLAEEFHITLNAAEN